MVKKIISFNFNFLVTILFLINPVIGEDEFPKGKISGDFRIRSEFDTNRSNDREDRERGRLRLRLKAVGDLNHQLSGGIQIRSGDSHNPVAANYSFYNSLAENEAFGIVLDQIWLSYKFNKDTSLTIGKTPLQFNSKTSMGKLIWDSDYSPVGICVAHKVDNETSYRFGSYVLERDGNAIALIGELDKNISNDLSIEFYVLKMLNLSEEAFLYNRGNIENKDTHNFESRFFIISPTINYNSSIGDIPILYSAQYIQNLQSANNGLGYALGFTAGHNKKARDLSGYYRYQYIEQDAVYSPITQDDFPASVNFKGHLAGIKYLIDANLQLEGWVLTAKPILGEGPEQVRFRLDLLYKF